MTFNSVPFLYFFFTVLTVFFCLPERWRLTFLLAASYFFYGFWSVKFLFLLIFTMVFDFFIAIGIEEAPNDRKRKNLLLISLTVNLGVLFFFKYFNFTVDTVFHLMGKESPAFKILLPFGISFYTFHALSYVIDVYRRVIPAERNFTWYSGYVMFFPQLVAGPIARASHLLHQFATPKVFRGENLVEGCYYIVRGYIMKVILADRFAGYVNAYFSTTDTYRSPVLILQAVYFFAFQIYFDFCGYTDIARGVAKIFDFDLVLNFNRPYFASSITDFWRRWHISLSTWLRDYLYISLGGNRKGKLLTYRNLLLTMLLGGLWHGANFTFVVWGGLHGLYLVAEKFFSGTTVEKAVLKVPRMFRVLVTFHLVCLAWIFFRAPNFSEAWTTLTACGEVLGQLLRGHWLGGFYPQLWVAALGWFTFEALEEKFDVYQLYLKTPIFVRVGMAYVFIFAIVLWAELNPQEFLYFQF